MLIQDEESVKKPVKLHENLQHTVADHRLLVQGSLDIAEWCDIAAH